MKDWFRTAMLVFLTVCGTTVFAAQQAAHDNMTPYRTLAADALQGFKAHDMATARKKAKELEGAWDAHEKALKKKSPDVWDQIDKAMDGFIKPVQNKSSDPAKVQTAYDTFIAKLQLAVTS